MLVTAVMSDRCGRNRNMRQTTSPYDHIGTKALDTLVGNGYFYVIGKV